MGAHSRSGVFRRQPPDPGPPDRSSPALDDDRAGLLARIAGLTREVEDLRLENQTLLQAMLIDRQTGLPNLAAFDADHIQLDARRRRGDGYAVLLADLDHFHAFNELFGEDAGCAAMQTVATTIGQTVRQADRTYRIGGEEFAILLPGAELLEAVAAAERVRAKVERLAILHPANDPGVVTITLAATGAGFRHQSSKDVLAELQDLMAAGKRAGRNQVVWPH